MPKTHFLSGVTEEDDVKDEGIPALASLSLPLNAAVFRSSKLVSQIRAVCSFELCLSL